MRNAINTLADLIVQGGSPFTVPWENLRYPHVQALRAALVAREGANAPATVNRHLAALRGVLREAWQLGLLTAEDYHRMRAVKGLKGSRLLAGRELSARELRVLFDACSSSSVKGKRDAALLALAYGCGLRRAELASLQLANVEPGAVAVRVLGKGDKERRVPAPPGTQRAVRAWIEARGSEPGPLLRRVRGGTVREGGLSSQAIYEALQRMRARVAEAVGEFSPHDLRRTYVGDLLDAGVDLSTAKALAGHEQVTTTARYDRRGQRAAEQAAERLNVPR